MIFVCVSTGHFDPLIQACDALRDRFDFLGQIGSGTYVPKFRHFRTGLPTEIQAHMREAELVISHAGTGMLSMLYRLKKPSIVVPKQVRYGEANDGQVELARQWGALQMGLLCLDIAGLEKALQQAPTFDFRFPSFPSLGSHLSRTLGWNEEKEVRHLSFTR